VAPSLLLPWGGVGGLSRADVDELSRMPVLGSPRRPAWSLPSRWPTGAARVRDPTPARPAAEPQTTRARLQSIIKESRNTMRKDARLHGELDRLPQLAWLLFLHAFDEVEQDRAAAVQRITVMLHH